MIIKPSNWRRGNFQHLIISQFCETPPPPLLSARANEMKNVAGAVWLYNQPTSQPINKDDQDENNTNNNNIIVSLLKSQRIHIASIFCWCYLCGSITDTEFTDCIATTTREHHYNCV